MSWENIPISVKRTADRLALTADRNLARGETAFVLGDGAGAFAISKKAHPKRGQSGLKAREGMGETPLLGVVSVV